MNFLVNTKFFIEAKGFRVLKINGQLHFQSLLESIHEIYLFPFFGKIYFYIRIRAVDESGGIGILGNLKNEGVCKLDHVLVVLVS